MSCFGNDDSDRDLSDYLGGPYERPNATCSDCGGEFVKGRTDVGNLCDRCVSDRDAWVLEYETRIARMAAADSKPLTSTHIPEVIESPVANVEPVTAAWAMEYDLRKMAKAVLAADLTKIRDVA